MLRKVMVAAGASICLICATAAIANATSSSSEKAKAHKTKTTKARTKKAKPPKHVPGKLRPIHDNDNGMNRPNRPHSAKIPALPASHAFLARAASATCRNGYVAITYDDGPYGLSGYSADTMGPLIRALQANRLKATFFDIGSREEAYPSIVQQGVNAGEAFGDHTYWHVYDAVGTWTDAHLATDIADTAQEHLYAGGPQAQPEQFFRPPYDQWVPTSDLPQGMTEVTWTLDDHVYDGTVAGSGAVTPKQIAAVYAQAGNGDIVLSHVGYPAEVQAVPLIAAALKKNGLCAGQLVHSPQPTTNWWGEVMYATTAPWGS